jgi:hypothetical protein
MTDIAFRDLANKLHNEPLPDTLDIRTGPRLAIKSLETQLSSVCVIQMLQSYFVSEKVGYVICSYGDAVVGFVLRGNDPVTIKLKYGGYDIHQPPITLTPDKPFSFAFHNTFIIPHLCLQFNVLSMIISPPERAPDVCIVYAYFRDDVRKEMFRYHCYARVDDEFVQFSSEHGMNPVKTPTLAKVELLNNRLGPGYNSRV